MSKVRTHIFGQETIKNAAKPIEMVKILEGKIFNNFTGNHGYSNLMLLEEDYYDTKMDLIWAYDSPNDGTLYLGHWNDGVA